MMCKSLYVLCMEFSIPRLEKYSRGLDENKDCKWIENLAGSVVEDLLNHAYNLSNKHNKSIKKIWKEEWKIFFTGNITSSILTWDSDLINYISNRCKSLKKCEVVIVNNFRAELILKLPKNVVTLDFDGELMNRGQKTKPLTFQEEQIESWLPHAEKILKALRILRTPQPDYPSSSNMSCLHEIHLGTVQTTASDLKGVINYCPNLRLLRHYQMVSALYQLHSDAWKKKQPLPKYKLKNLDVDFSHVVRCRMSPEWVLSPDALQLAVVLCPSATSVRVRFDCSTPNDVLAPLTSLPKLEEFSAVCVSSGERTLLDFSDMSPIFEQHGPNTLQYLELKVIEEVEIHVIIEYCTKLETLVLSGCGYVTPTTCSSFGCHRYEKGSFKKLRLLFYADGDDFSWDHGVPDCFWRASLCPSSKTRVVQLQGLFLEFPRMSKAVLDEIFASPKSKTSTKLPFPELEALSFCRFEEITVEQLAAICGLFTTGETYPNQSLKYMRLSQCEKINQMEEKRLKNWLKHSKLNHLKVDVDRGEEETSEKRKPYTFKIFRPRM